MTHQLKTLSEFWDAVKSGKKTFEVRKNDRNFRVGDTLELIRHADWDERTITCEIVYILIGGQFGIEPGYVVIGLEGSMTGEELAKLNADRYRLDRLEALPGIALRYNPDDVAMPLSLRSEIDAFLARLDKRKP